MATRAIELLNIINNAIEELNTLNVLIKDFENQDWRLNKVEYQPVEDEVFFYTKDYTREARYEPNYRDKG